MTLLIPLKSWQRRHFVGCFPSLLLLSMAISEGLGHGGISNSPGKPYFMHCSLILCLSSSRGRPWPSCAFCASTVWATQQTSHGCIRHIIPASSISSIFASVDLGCMIVVAPLYKMWYLLECWACGLHLVWCWLLWLWVQSSLHGPLAACVSHHAVDLWCLAQLWPLTGFEQLIPF